MCEKGAGGARVNLVTALAGAVGRGRGVFSQHFEGTLGTNLGRGAVLVFQDDATEPAGKREK